MVSGSFVAFAVHSLFYISYHFHVCGLLQLASPPFCNDAIPVRFIYVRRLVRAVVNTVRVSVLGVINT